MPAARITVVTSGHLSTCPRMLKAADALADDGHDVRVVATRHEPWATETDLVVQATRRWRLVTIDYRRGEAGSTYWRTGARYRAARAVAETLGPDRSPFPVVTRAFGRVHTELVAAGGGRVGRPSLWRDDGCAGGRRRSRRGGCASPTRSISKTCTTARHRASARRSRTRLHSRIERAVLPRGEFSDDVERGDRRVHTAAIRRGTAGRAQHVSIAVAPARPGCGPS